MIHGDIDLTENLDFYRDKKEKSYKNTSDFNPPSLLSSNAKWNNFEIPAIQSNLNGITWTNYYNNYTTTYTTTYPITDNIRLVNSDGDLATINDDSTSTIANTEPDMLISNSNSDITTYRYNFNGGWRELSNISTTVSYNISSNNSTYTYNIPLTYISTKRPSTCDKLFGVKENKVYSSSGVISRFKNKPKKVYSNCVLFTRLFDGGKYVTVNLRKHRLGRLFGYGHELDPLYNIFGSKKDPFIDDYRYSPIPWLDDFASRHRSLYEDYIEELRGNERDNESFLTNYSWLRIH